MAGRSRTSNLCTHTLQDSQMSMTITEQDLYIKKPAKTQPHSGIMSLLPVFGSDLYLQLTQYKSHAQAGISALIASFWVHLSTQWLNPSICQCILTVWVFIRQPVVLVAVEFIARVQSVALLLSWITVDILTLVGVAHLELVNRPHTGAASVGWSGRAAEQKTYEYCSFVCLNVCCVSSALIWNHGIPLTQMILMC